MHWAERDHEIYQPGRREYLLRALQALHLQVTSLRGLAMGGGYRRSCTTRDTSFSLTSREGRHAKLTPEGAAGSRALLGPHGV